MDEKDYAWFCGEDFQYFRILFTQIPQFIKEDSKVIIILSEVCEIDRIREIASEKNFELIEVKRIRNWREWNYIFRIKNYFSKTKMF
jgi:release factor glutamine methyltransferase